MSQYMQQQQQQQQQQQSQMQQQQASQFNNGGSSYRGIDRSYQPSPVKNSQMITARRYEEEPQSSGIDSQSRVNYLRKLYLAVFLQVGLASLFTYFSENSVAFRAWVINSSGLTFILAMIVTIALSLASFLQKAQLSRPVVNFVSYIIYSLAFATLWAYIDAIWSPNVHYFFLFLTYLMLGLFVHALLCFGPITFQNAALFVIGSVLIVVLRLEIFSELSFQTIYIFAIITILLGFYIVWENETVISGAKTLWSREDPVVGSIGFFLNLFTLFLRLANLLSRITVVQYSRPA